RYLTVGYLVEDVELVRDEVDAAAEEAAHLGLAETIAGIERAQAQVEHLGRIGLAGEQTLGRGADAGDVGDGVLAHAATAADIDEQAGLLFDRLDGETRAVAGRDGFAFAELHAFEHGGASGVNAFFAGGG